jgi:hypothetical protein
LVPENFLCWQKEKREGRKRGKERKEGKGKKEKKEKKKNRKKGRVTAPISSHFIQGQTLGVGGAPKIIYEITLIAECSLICRFYPLCWLGIVPLPWFQNLLSVLFPSLLNFNSQFLFLLEVVIVTATVTNDFICMTLHTSIAY